MQRNLRILAEVTSYIIWAPVMLVGLVSRPLWRFLLSCRIAFLRLLLFKSPAFQYAINRTLFLLLFERRASWQEFRPVLEGIFSPSNRAAHISIVINLYWINERFDEARDAARYGCAVTDEWVSNHLEDTRRALHLLRKTRSWPRQYQLGPYLSDKEDLRISKEAATQGGAIVRTWRDLHITLAILEWAKKHDRKAHKLVAKMDVNRNPLCFAFIAFDSDIAYSLGIDVMTFDQICKDAENLDRFERPGKQIIAP